MMATSAGGGGVGGGGTAYCRLIILRNGKVSPLKTTKSLEAARNDTKTLNELKENGITVLGFCANEEEYAVFVYKYGITQRTQQARTEGLVPTMTSLILNEKLGQECLLVYYGGVQLWTYVTLRAFLELQKSLAPEAKEYLDDFRYATDEELEDALHLPPSPLRDLTVPYFPGVAGLLFRRLCEQMTGP